MDMEEDSRRKIAQLSLLGLDERQWLRLRIIENKQYGEIAAATRSNRYTIRNFFLSLYKSLGIPAGRPYAENLKALKAYVPALLSLLYDPPPHHWLDLGGSDHLGFQLKRLAANWEVGWRRTVPGSDIPKQSHGTIRQSWASEPILLPGEVEAVLPTLRQNLQEVLLASPAPFYNSTIAVAADIKPTADKDLEVHIAYQELDFLTSSALRRNLDTPGLLTGDRTIRQSFLESQTHYSSAIAPNLFLVTRDGRLLIGKRGSKLATLQNMFSHASGGLIATKVAPNKPGILSNDLDEGGVPDLFLTAIRECAEETGCEIGGDDIVFNSIILNPRTSAIDAYGFVEVGENADRIIYRDKVTDELTLVSLPMDDLERIFRQIGGNSNNWIQDDLLGLLYVLCHFAQHRWGERNPVDYVFNEFRRYRRRGRSKRTK